MKILKTFWSIIFRIVCALIDSIRPMLGPRGVCIYHVKCRTYAKHMLKKKPLYKSIPLICLRLLSCNPITAIYFRFKYR